MSEDVEQITLEDGTVIKNHGSVRHAHWKTTGEKPGHSPEKKDEKPPKGKPDK